MIMGMPRTTTLVELMREWVKRTANKIPPKWVGSGPCKENVMKGDQINLLKFPVPKVFPKDGGRFFGTTAYTVSKDPETGWLNIGFTGNRYWTRRRLGSSSSRGNMPISCSRSIELLRSRCRSLWDRRGSYFFLNGCCKAACF